MPKRDSYRPRANMDCHFLDDCRYTPCWGLVRFGSSGIYTCEGHARIDRDGVGVYVPEPPPSRPIPPPPPDPPDPLPQPGDPVPLAGASGVRWGDLSVPMLRALHAAVADWHRLMDGYDHPGFVRPRLERLYLEGWAELTRRGVPPLTDAGPHVQGDLLNDDQVRAIADALPFGERSIRSRAPFPAADEALDLADAPDDTVLILYGVGAEVVDFSMLGNGVRQMLTSVWATAEGELKVRSIRPLFLMDVGG